MRIDGTDLLREAQRAGDASVIIRHFPDADAGILRQLADDLRGRAGRFVLVASGDASSQPIVVVAASRDLAAEGFDAVAIARAAAERIGGGGGGRADLAQAGGRDLDRLDEALREAGRHALEALARLEAG
jgi:alanyl-tRNA synthetase